MSLKYKMNFFMFIRLSMLLHIALVHILFKTALYEYTILYPFFWRYPYRILLHFKWVFKIIFCTGIQQIKL